MTQACLLETLARDLPTQATDTLEDPIGEAEEVAPGIFFLKGGTHYFRDGVRDGAAGSVRRLMCNNGWIVLGDRVLLIDANMPGRADALLAAVRRTTDKPVRHVLNTHHHGDHLYGNRAIHDRTGAEIIAYAGMIDELRRYETGAFGGPPGRHEQVAQARPDVAATPIMLPTRTFTDPLVLEGGGMRVDLFHPGFGHTRGDAVAWVPEHGVMFVGDLATNGPFNIVRDAEIPCWVDTLAALRALEPAVVCPGHGDWGGGSLLTEQRSFFVALLREVRGRIAEGLDRETILAELETIRTALLCDFLAAGYVIPREADLAVLSLRAQVERAWSQLQPGYAPAESRP